MQTKIFCFTIILIMLINTSTTAMDGDSGKSSNYFSSGINAFCTWLGNFQSTEKENEETSEDEYQFIEMMLLSAYLCSSTEFPSFDRLHLIDLQNISKLLAEELTEYGAELASK